MPRILIPFKNPLIWILVSVCVLSAAWYIYPAFIFVGFVPFFIVHHYYFYGHQKYKFRKFWLLIYTGLLLWNVATTWWVYNSTVAGSMAAFTLNAFFMTLPFVCFYAAIWVAKVGFDVPVRWLARFGYYLFIPLWIAFEHIHLRWDLSWPWLTLGNVFSTAPYLVQWYDVTGVLGGTFWVLMVNVGLFSLWAQYKTGFSTHIFFIPYLKKAVLYNIFLIAVPIILSVFRYHSVQMDTKIPITVGVIQPNIDPYLEKFNGTPQFIPFENQLKRFFHLSDSIGASNLDILLWPETALPAGYDEDLIFDQPHIRQIQDYVNKNPKLALITGSETYKIYLGEFDKTPTSRYAEGLGYYDYFNSAVFFQPKHKPKIYHKSKLVPGVEQMPYPQFFSFLETFAIDLGGITGSLGKQDKRTVFYHKNQVGIAPVICYESVYGAFINEYIHKGASLIAIITNDGWWGNTPGHIQHFDYARLRAIETRRYVARSANTGISGFINPMGKVLSKTIYWTKDALKETVYAQHHITFYVQYGDYLGLIACVASYFIIGLTVVNSILIQIMSKKKK